MTTQTTNNTSVIYSCTNNHPRLGVREDYNIVTEWEDLPSGNSIPVRTRYFNSKKQEITLQNHFCPTCNSAMKMSTVFAIMNEEGKCDFRCIHAVGSKCVCACGGPNHGKYWLQP